MNGYVFQMPSERKNKGHFSETLEALQLYACKHFKKDIEDLQPLFDKLVLPQERTKANVVKANKDPPVRVK